MTVPVLSPLAISAPDPDSGETAITSQLRAILPAAAAGTFLRLWNLRDQVLVGDEVHAVRAALGGDLATVLTTYQDADPCLPLAGLYRLMIEVGIPVSEMALRLPVLLTGILTLGILPLILGRLVPRARAAFAWLLALSPTLILYSRIVRPYAPIVLWSGMAAGCFWIFWKAWQAEGKTSSAAARSRWAVAGFLICATLAVWFHLGTAPLVTALFGYALLDLALARPAAWRRPLRNLVFTGFALAVVMALPLLPAAASLGQLATSKRVTQDVPATTYAAVGRLVAGTNIPIVASLFWIAALVGLVRLFREAPRVALFSVTLVIGQLVGLRLLSPIALNIPIAFHRYLLPVLPFVLLWAAVAISPPWRQRRRLDASHSPTAVGFRHFAKLGSRRITLLLPASLLAGLTLCGPFTNRNTWRTSFLHDAPYVDFSQPPRRPHAEIVARNAWLAQQPGSRAVIEAIWPPNRYGSYVFDLAQQVHARPVIVVAPGLAGHSAVSFRNFVAPKRSALLATDAQFLVLRGDVRSAPSPPGAARHGNPGSLPRQLRRWLGRPTWQEGDIQVWDLDVARARPPRGLTGPTRRARSARARTKKMLQVGPTHHP